MSRDSLPEQVTMSNIMGLLEVPTPYTVGSVTGMAPNTINTVVNGTWISVLLASIDCILNI